MDTGIRGKIKENLPYLLFLVLFAAALGGFVAYTESLSQGRRWLLPTALGLCYIVLWFLVRDQVKDRMEQNDTPAMAVLFGYGEPASRRALRLSAFTAVFLGPGIFKLFHLSGDEDTASVCTFLSVVAVGFFWKAGNWLED